ncbi:hypothetical protein [Entomomonas asaccharolytica]|uniref:Uncharacterized protein n=1 Tax=Entomomonas asaccharolytica TaxID=2785331 RepID=A0A974NDX4_9GAMM|nr:hypothetical protein [Entomomonas asaccharolytica]QQP85001.1 hypothetical protein JHT90_11465 [Entomomonas asaccharolytica]
MINNTPYDDEINQTKKQLELLDVEINKLRGEIEKLEIQQHGKYGVLEYLENKKSTYLQDAPEVKEITGNIYTDKESQGVNELIDLSQLNIPIPRKRTLIDDIWSIILKLGDQEFDSPIIMTVLTSKGIEVEGKTPSSRVSTVLSKLHKKGKIEQTFKGGGNIPNRYKLAQKVNQSLPDNEFNDLYSGDNTNV